MTVKTFSARLREGYELVRAEEYPDFEAPVIETGKYAGIFGVGGLLLARIPLETVEERSEYFKKRSQDQMEAVDRDLARENSHSSMTIGKPDRQSRVTFGGPRKLVFNLQSVSPYLEKTLWLTNLRLMVFAL